MSSILILDFGSQYTQLIARRIREMGVYCEIHPYTLSPEAIHQFAPQGIILSGGPESVTHTFTPRAPQIVFELGCPVLGICYGMQTMAVQLQGKVASSMNREFGHTDLVIEKPDSLLLNDIQDGYTHNKPFLNVWMSHGDHVTHLPAGFHLLASTHSCPIVGMADEERHFYGLQFHPEVSHTPQGKKIIERFVFTLCQCQPNWLPKDIIAETITHIKAQVKTDQVILGLSGGVDSSVAAALLQTAIGEQLTCVFVDTGLLRRDEAKEIKALFANNMKINLITVDAEEIFLSALEGIDDPEKKRKIIGKLFIDIFNAEAKKIKRAKWLAQGTIYSDVIESAANDLSQSHLIKSHHNVGGLPAHMELKLIEPLRELFKDEVIKIGLLLGLPQALLKRHPFPGPGLSVRVLGSIKKIYLEKLRGADAIFLEELKKWQLYEKVSQAFAVFLPIKSVGVLGDARHYDHVIALRAVETEDFMTAHCARLPHEFLECVSNRIINEVAGISRVVYDVSSKPPATIEWE